VSWVESERKQQERIDKAFSGRFDDHLRHRHMLWAQTFRKTELRDALYACFLSILGRELTVAPPKETPAQPLKSVLPQKTSFPPPAEG
jgi:hypothetical protein